jgi:hypothetical protein
MLHEVISDQAALLRHNAAVLQLFLLAGWETSSISSGWRQAYRKNGNFATLHRVVCRFGRCCCGVSEKIQDKGGHKGMIMQSQPTIYHPSPKATAASDDQSQN